MISIMKEITGVFGLIGALLPPAQSRVSGKRKLMIVDNDENFAKKAKKAFEAQGFTVTVYTDSAKAVRMAPKAQPDLIFLNLNMGGGEDTGFRIASKLRYHPKTRNTPIIATSASGLEKEGFVFLDVYGISSVLEKPVNMDTALKAAEEAITDENP